MSEPTFSHSALAEYVVDANEVLRFKLVKTASDMDDPSLEFPPEMSHQIYGDNENIFGYRGLKLQLFMAASSLRAWVSTCHTDKVDPAKTDGVTADDVLSPLVKVLAPGSFTSSREEFVAGLESEEELGFQPPGEVVASWGLEGGRTAQVFLASEATPGLRDYHERLQAWILFFIDAASYIDIDDDSWRFFLLFEKDTTGATPRFTVLGYLTVYEYYAYGRESNRKRPRVAQMLVLPPYQRLGLGAKLLDTVYQHYRADRAVLDITVEDPSDNFVRLRDFVDTRSCLQLASFSGDKMAGGFSEAMAAEAQRELKICRKQARRVYEIVRLHHTSLADREQYRQYRVDVKRRLNAPYQKEQSQLAKLQKALKPEEFAAAMVNVTNREQRMESLEKQYSELEQHYRQVLEKVAAA